MSALDRRDRGVTLAEILVGMALMSLAFAALLGGVLTVSRTSRGHSDQATAGALLTTAAEALRSESVTWEPCAIAADYIDPLRNALPPNSVPAGWSVDIQDPILDWDGSSFVDDAPGGTEFCNNPALPLQLVTVVVRGSDGDVMESIPVVKT